MIQLLTDYAQVDISGSVSELHALRDSLRIFVVSQATSLTIPADAGGDPSAWPHQLEAIHVMLGSTPLSLTIQQNAILRAAGSASDITWLAQWFDFSPNAMPGYHSHYEFADDNTFVAAGSIPIIVSVSHART